MYPIRMTHPQHGAAHAYDFGEQKRLESHGWKVEVPVVVPAVDMHDSAPVEHRKPGRPKKS